MKTREDMDLDTVMDTDMMMDTNMCMDIWDGKEIGKGIRMVMDMIMYLGMHLGKL